MFCRYSLRGLSLVCSAFPEGVVAAVVQIPLSLALRALQLSNKQKLKGVALVAVMAADLCRFKDSSHHNPVYAQDADMFMQWLESHNVSGRSVMTLCCC